MQLTYRGVKYDMSPNQVTTVAGAVMGKYRGAAWAARDVTSPLPTAAVQTLCWRGVVYNTDGSLVPQSVAQPIVARDVAAIQSRKPIMAQLNGDVHRNAILKSLEHRLEVARNRGDQGLVQILEEEWNQFA